MKVCELVPGYQIGVAGMTATYIAQVQHPLWPSLQLVIWRLPDGSCSLDALAAAQDVGDLIPGDSVASLRKALVGS